MRFKSPEKETEYQDYVAINKDDPYSSAVVIYGENWAHLMESSIPEIATDEEVEQTLTANDFGKKSSHEADAEGITGFMYGCAVSALANFWKHGEGLRRWHNLKTQMKDEGTTANETGGVLNPAILMLG